MNTSKVAQVSLLIQHFGWLGFYPASIAQWLDPETARSYFTQKPGSTGVLKQNGLGELNFSTPRSLNSGLHHQVLSLNEDVKQKSLAHHIRLHKGRSL